MGKLSERAGGTIIPVSDHVQDNTIAHILSSGTLSPRPSAALGSSPPLPVKNRARLCVESC
jgi:hypothetical protein